MSKPNYQTNYYERNKERILENRRKRYLKDKPYRDTLKARAALAWRLKPITKIYTVVHDGQPEAIFIINQLAEYIGRDDYTLYDWVRTKRIPPSIYHVGKRKCFSESQANLLRHVLSEVDNGLLVTYSVMYHILRTFWKKTFNKEEVDAYIKEEKWTHD